MIFAYTAILTGIMTFLYGLGAARLMFWILDIVLTRLPAKILLENIFGVISWFVAGAGLMVGSLKLADLITMLGFAEASGIALMCYLGGFGLGSLLLDFWNKPSLVRDLRKYMGDDEVEAILLILRYSVSPEDAAATLGIPTAQMIEIYRSALRKLKSRGKRLIDAISSTAPKKP